MNVDLLLARLEERLREVKRFQSLIDLVNEETISSTRISTRKTSWMLCEGEIVSLTNTIELIKEMHDV
jgi:hypothetical protein